MNPIAGDCFASSASRCCFVNTVSGFGAPAMFPPNGLLPWRPLPSAGFPWGGFPDFDGTMERSDSLPPVPPRFVGFAWRYHPWRLSSSLPLGPTPAGGPGLSGLAAPRQHVKRWQRQGVPSSWGTPVCLCPGLRPRQDRHPRPLRAAGAAPAVTKAKAPASQDFEAQYRALARAVYASSRELPPPNARLASGCWPGSPGRDWLPAGSQRKVLKVYPLHPRLLSQVAWRNVTSVFHVLVGN